MKQKHVTVTVKAVCDTMEEYAPLALSYPEDKGGLLVGDPETSVRCVLTALSITEDVVRTAIKRRVDMIVTHHPVIWEPLSHLRTDAPTVRVCFSLLKAGISCFSAHTCLDLAKEGVNEVLAKKIGLQEIQPLLPVAHVRQVKLVTFVPESHLAQVRTAVCEAGAGIIGEYRYCSFSSAGVGTFMPSDKARPFCGKNLQINEEPERRFEVLLMEADLPRVLRAMRAAHPYEEPAYDVVPLKNSDTGIGLGRRGVLPRPMAVSELARELVTLLQLPGVRIVGNLRRRVRRAAVLGGSGGSYVREIPEDVDVLITGDVRYHDALDAQARDLTLIDIGHAGGERCIVPVLAAYLRKKLPISVLEYKDEEPFVFWNRK
ncbi:MAG TPA: Nif3-like dinuclear metal center hexameric protein [Candidatus Hydrogenedentes bacterium]|nr:Nif3-like dinuclear metal center hexameric protein [Candidatus Hydrogenedentota bacterium]HOL77804.1 Nif3-like dinuclear metal center hexameric protein [Candidatus Hydrogenedentota bacterium]HPO86866.1 Nif3-like dinuclear metal center hexameric protein [Candidatus Hydrogenedentota bacterium]